MAKRKLYWGTRERMTWIPCPAINAGLGSSRWLATGGFLNGGAYQRQSTIGAKTYSFAWNPQAAEGLYELDGYFDGIHGQGPFYFLDPFAATSNILPAFLAAPCTMAGDAPNFGGTQRISRVLTGTNPQGYPAQSGQFTVGSAFGPYKSYTMPIPADHQLHLGVHGSASGTASVTATLSGVSIQRTNLATNPKLTDTYGTTTVPAIATNLLTGPLTRTGDKWGYSSEGKTRTEIANGQRLTVTELLTGPQSLLYTRTENLFAPTVGSAYTLLLPVRNSGSVPWDVHVLWWMRTGMGSGGNAASGASGLIPIMPGESRVVRVTTSVAPADAGDLRFSLYYSQSQQPPVGSVIDILDGITWVEGDGVGVEPFSGDTTNSETFAYVWDGAVNSSTSSKRYAVAVSGTAPAPRSMSGSGLSSNAAMTSGGNARVYVEGDYLVVDSITSPSMATSAYLARGTTAAGDAMKRLNLVPGKTYAMGVLYSQDTVHAGPFESRPRQINTVYRNAAGVDAFNYVVSNLAPNEVQVDTPLTMAFTVPADAQDYAVRLLSGSSGMLDRAKFRNLIICEGVNEADALSKVQAYFDGDTVFGGWTGVANRSTSEFPRNGTQNLPILPVSSAQRTNVVIPGESWCDISVGGEGTLTLAGLIGQILPTGQTVEPGDFIPGRGNTGVRLSGNPSVTGYSAALNNASVGMTAEFVETGAWEQ